jgi:hypothetical protein
MRSLYLEGIGTPSNTWLTDTVVAMTGLTSLSLGHDTNMYGHDPSAIPTQIALLTALEVLEMANTGLAGTLPTGFGRLTKLTYLDLWANDLSGTIPTEIGLLTDLGVLILFDNLMLTGLVPSEVGSLTKLSVANLALTTVSPQIPPEVCALGLEIKMSEDPYREYANGQYIDACE